MEPCGFLCFISQHAEIQIGKSERSWFFGEKIGGGHRGANCHCCSLFPNLAAHAFFIAPSHQPGNEGVGRTVFERLGVMMHFFFQFQTQYMPTVACKSLRHTGDRCLVGTLRMAFSKTLALSKLAKLDPVHINTWVNFSKL